MPEETGRLSDNIGPMTALPGMDFSTPEQAVPPARPEALFNVDLDTQGRPVARQGSVFGSRLGAGPVLGVAEHTFEITARSRRLVAIVANAYPEANTRGSENDGVAGGSAAFFADALVNGEPAQPISARDTDRFHFESFLDKLYYAGSTITYALREHNFDTGRDVRVPGVSGTAVTAVGNRLFVAGDPGNPNLVYPSDPDAPTTFQPQLAFQLGTKTDRILRLLEHAGLLVAFGSRAASWALVGAVELGDIQSATFSPTDGIVGPLAADEAGDGWVYWIAPNRGPLRWQRGLSAPDASFAKDAYSLWEVVEAGVDDLTGAVVRWDQGGKCVRFELPGAGLLMSYFPDGGAWAFGADTTALDALELREQTVLDAPMGSDRYTALANHSDPITGNSRIYAGDADGFVWVWTNRSPDKVRSPVAGEAGTDFTSCIRWGNVEVAPAGYRAILESLLVSFLGGYLVDFTVSAEMDHTEWLQVEAIRREQAGGRLPMDLSSTDDGSRLFEERFHPMHIRAANWERLIGKVVRLQMSWTGSMESAAVIGIEMVRSLEPEAEDDVRSMPTVPPDSLATTPVEFLAGDGVGTSSVDGSTTVPHAPPPLPGGDPADVSFMVTADPYDPSSASGTIGVTKIDDSPVPGNVPGAVLDYGTHAYTYHNDANHVMVSEDGLHLFVVDGTATSAAAYPIRIMHYDLTDPLAPVKSAWEYPIYADLGSLGEGVDHCWGAFYSDATQRLYLVVWNNYPANNHNLLIYDMSDLVAGPQLLLHKIFETGVVSDLGGIELTQDELYIFIGDQGDNTPGPKLHALSLNAAGTAATYLGYINPHPGHKASDGVWLRRLDTTHLLMASAGNYTQRMDCVDISNPAAMTVLSWVDFTTATGDNHGRAGPIAINPDNTRAYVKVYVTPALKNGWLLFDVSDPGAIAYLGYQNESTDGGVGGVQVFNGIHYVPSPTGLGDYLVVMGYGPGFSTWDVSVDLAAVRIDTGPTAGNQCMGMGFPRGPQCTRFGADRNTSVLPTPVGANVGVVTGPKNVVGLLGLTDFAAPTFDAWIKQAALEERLGPTAQFVYDGLYLVVLGGATGTVIVYELGATFTEVARLQDDNLIGARGLMSNGFQETLYTVTQRSRCIKIDLSDPTAPALTVTAMGPAWLGTPDYGSAVARARNATLIVNDQFGPSFISQATQFRVGSTLPPELWATRAVALDATYAYLWNEVAGGGLAVVNHTSTPPTLVGYVHLGTCDAVGSLVLYGTHVYVVNGSSLEIFDVSSPVGPLHLATYDAGNQIAAAAMSGANEVVLFGAEELGFTIQRVNVTAPAAPVLTSELSDTRVLCAGAVANSKAVGWVEGEALAVAYTLGVPPAEASTVATVAAGARQGRYVGGGDYVAALVGSGATTYLQVLDLTNAAALAVRGTSAAVAHAIGLGIGSAVASHTAVVVQESQPGSGSLGIGSKLWIYDLSAAAPALKQTFESEESDWPPYCAAVLGSVAVVGRDLGAGGILVLDLTTLTAVAVQGNVGDGWIARRDATGYAVLPVRAQGRAVGYVSRPTQRVYGLNLTSTSNPFVSSHTELAASAVNFRPQAAAISDDGNRLWVGVQDVAGGSWRLECWDVSAPAAVPVRLGYVAFSREIRAVRVSGTDYYVVVAHGGAGDIPKVAIYDFTAEAAPVKLGEAQIGDQPWLVDNLEIY